MGNKRRISVCTVEWSNMRAPYQIIYYFYYVVIGYTVISNLHIQFTSAVTYSITRRSLRSSTITATDAVTSDDNRTTGWIDVETSSIKNRKYPSTPVAVPTAESVYKKAARNSKDWFRTLKEFVEKLLGFKRSKERVTLSKPS